MQDYLEWKASTTKNPATVKQYAMWIRRFLAFVDDRKIDLELVGEFKKYLKMVCLYSPKNIQYGLQLVRDYISYQNTVHGLDFPLRLLKIPQERSKSHSPVTHEDFLKMVSVLPLNEPITLQRRLMLTLLWETGMRVGELTRLKISNLEERGAIIENEKNHRSRRIGWSEQTEKMLKFYLPLRRNLQAKEDYLFVSFKWKPSRKLTTRQIERIIQEIRAKSGVINYVKPHSFRHGFVHRHLAKKTPITTIAQMLGHSTTFNVMAYAQLNSAEILEAWRN